MPSEEALKLATLINRVAGIIADIGVFPTANYADFAAFVEAVRTRLIDIETDTGAITWGDITGIVNDLGVFPTTNYATFAAFVEDVRTRLIAIPTVMVGTDGAALVADGWDAALATILDNFTALRIGYLEELDFDLAGAIAAIPAAPSVGAIDTELTSSHGAGSWAGTANALLAANYKQFTKGLTEQAAFLTRAYGVLASHAYHDLLDVSGAGYLTGLHAVFHPETDYEFDIVIEVDGSNVGPFTNHEDNAGNIGKTGATVCMETTWHADYKWVLMVTPMYRFDSSLKVRIYAAGPGNKSVGAMGTITYLTE